jgi:vacuolar-type H+-ATPase subunit H
VSGLEFYRRLADHAGLPFAEDVEAATGTALSSPAAAAFGVVPTADDGRTLTVATADPARVDVPGLSALTRREIELVVAPPDALAKAVPPSPPIESPLFPPAQERSRPADLVSVDVHEFSRSLRGYRRPEVDAAMARHAAEIEMLQSTVDAAEARAQAMQVEIRELHARVDDLREREAAATRALQDLRDRREQMDREARTEAQQLVLEAQERATLLKTEGLRQVGELQAQVEQLIGMRAGLTQALQRLSEDIAAAMARIASAPATAIDRPVEHHVERWSLDA